MKPSKVRRSFMRPPKKKKKNLPDCLPHGKVQSTFPAEIAVAVFQKFLLDDHFSIALWNRILGISLVFRSSIFSLAKVLSHALGRHMVFRSFNSSPTKLRSAKNTSSQKRKKGKEATESCELAMICA